MEQLYAEDDPTITLKTAIDLNELRDTEKGVEFETEDESKNQEEDTDVYKVFDQDDVFKNMYQNDFEYDEDELDTFERIKAKMVDISGGDQGVMKRMLHPGSGNVVTPESGVRVHYNLYLEGSDEPFDSSRLRGEMCKFRLGNGAVIPGLEVAVSSMKKGEKSQFIFTSKYAYGKMGCGLRIPGNACILAEVELLSFIEQDGVDDFYNMTEAERKATNIEQIMKVCKAHNNDGKVLFQSKQYQKSFTRYKKAVDILEMYRLKNEKEEEQQQKMLLKLYLNMSLCCLNLCHSGRAINYCKRALEIEPKNCKALFRFGKALRQIQEFEKSRNYYHRAQTLEPHNKEISQALVELENIVKKTRVIEENFCRRMFSATITDKEEKPAKVKSESSGVNEGFKDTVVNVLNSFKEDHSSLEMKFPPTQLTPPEIACILEVALDNGLDVRQFGSGQNLRLKIMKKSPSN